MIVRENGQPVAEVPWEGIVEGFVAANHFGLREELREGISSLIYKHPILEKVPAGEINRVLDRCFFFYVNGSEEYNPDG